MTEQAEQMIQKFDTLVHQALTLAEEGDLKGANEVWHGGIIQTFVELWHLTQEPRLRDCPYCGGAHQAGAVESCPLNPKNTRNLPHSTQR